MGTESNKEKMNITISDAKPSDVEGIQELFYKTWLATYPNEKFGITVDDIEDRFKDRLSPEKLEKRREQIKNMPHNEKGFIAKDGDKVVGACYVVKYDDHNQLRAIYVLPEYQGKGIGRMLWEKAKEFFDPEKDVTVEVASYNQKTVDFYSKLGFRDTGRRFAEERTKMKSGSNIPQMEMRISRGT